MTKNPFYNALSAIIYIVMIVFLVNSISNDPQIESSLLMPIMMISLLTLSAAVMACIFFYQPLRLYLDGKKEQAVKLLTKTIGIFAIAPFGLFLLYFLGILS